MLIDVTPFTSGPRQIENAVLTQKNPNQVAVAERISGYIDHYQPLFLRRALGNRIWAAIDEYTRYEHCDKDEEKERLIGLLKEPFADFVFFHMLRDMNVQPTITGLVRLKCANDYVSPIDKQVQTWNHMADELRYFLCEAEIHGVEGVDIDIDMLTYINNFNL